MEMNGKQKLVGQQTKLLTGGSLEMIGVLEEMKGKEKDVSEE